MAAITLTNCAILVGSTDLGLYTASVDVMEQVAMQEVPVLGGGGFMRKAPGIRSFRHLLDGWADHDAGAVSSVFTPAALGTQYAVSALPTGGATAGDRAIFTRGKLATYSPLTGALGDPAGFSLELAGDTNQLHGLVAHPAAARTTSGNGTAVQLAGPTSSQRVYAALHVLATSGTPSCAVKLQSDDNSGMTSPTDRVTFTAATAAGWQFASAAGAITDSWWRATWTISGGSPSVTFVVVFGVGA